MLELLPELRRKREELTQGLKTLGDALDDLHTLAEGLDELINAGADAEAGGSPPNKKDRASDVTFLLVDGVPTKPTEVDPVALNRSNQTQMQKQQIQMLDEWRESFVVSEQDAVELYNSLYVENVSGKHVSKRVSDDSRSSVISLQQYHPVYWGTCADSVVHAWQVFTLVMIMCDVWSVPLTLAWPGHQFLGFYQEVRPVLWAFDILMSLLPCLVELGESKCHIFVKLKQYAPRLPFDVGLVYVDILMFIGLNEEWRLLQLLILVRITKVKRGLIFIENHLAARGNIKLVLYLTIFRCIVQILAVNHVLTCFFFWLGTWEARNAEPNWIQTYNIGDDSYSLGFQYFLTFNWVIAQYTPAPFPLQPQNFREQVFVVGIILTCLPLLGSEIGKVSGTVNLLNEKARERDTLRRDLQRWLRKTEAAEVLSRRILASLNDVLTSKDSPLDVKEPMALKFLPSTLLEELRILKMSEKLSSHHLFNMLMDPKLGISGDLSSIFKVKHVVQGESAFQAGERAEGLCITQSGAFHLHQPPNGKSATSRGTQPQSQALVKLASRKSAQHFSVKAGEELKDLGGLQLLNNVWIAEACLYCGMSHSCCLTARTYSKVLSVAVPDFVAVIMQFPASVVAVHEYAVYIIRWLTENRGEIWEITDDEVIAEGVQRTQLLDLLVPGTGRIHRFKSSTQTDFSDMILCLTRQGQSNKEIIEEIKFYMPELRADGLYGNLGCDDEKQRAFLSVLSAVWLVNGDYTSMVECQKPGARLRMQTFNLIRENLCIREMTTSQITVAILILAIRGLSKTDDVARLCPPSERRRPEDVLYYAVSNLDPYLPSIASIKGEVFDMMICTVRMLGEFNFAQLLQGENNPHSVWQLQSARKEEGQEVFSIFLLVHVCILCGVTGAVTLDGSLFLTELNGRSVLKGLACLQDLSNKEPPNIYWHYIAVRAEALQLKVQEASHLVLARLACLTRTVDTESLKQLNNDWNALSDSEQNALQEIFLLDGHTHKAFMFMYLPLFLTNAMGNKGLGLRAGLQGLVELYNKLLKHQCLKEDVSTVKVDMSALANLAKGVDDYKLLRQCLDHSRIVKHVHGVTVLMTAKSYQVLSGQLVTENRSVDMLEMVVARQRQLEAAMIPKEVRPLPLLQVSEEEVVEDMF